MRCKYCNVRIKPTGYKGLEWVHIVPTGDVYHCINTAQGIKDPYAKAAPSETSEVREILSKYEM